MRFIIIARKNHGVDLADQVGIVFGDMGNVAAFGYMSGKRCILRPYVAHTGLGNLVSGKFMRRQIGRDTGKG